MNPRPSSSARRAPRGARLVALAALLAAALAALVRAAPAAAQASQQPAPAAVPPDSWAAQLDALGRWFEHRRSPARCSERCYVLHRMRITGALDGPGLAFEVEGAVLADGPVAVPLFGPPDRVRLEQVTENGAPATVGFEGDHYYAFTAARRFVLRGNLALQGDLALAIPGPLNALEAELTGARVVEGARLSGLANATIHFDRGASAAPAAEPTVFQLARAVRVGREVAFEYRLVMRSGSDLGVVRLPLRYGERVLDVAGSTGWRVEGTELVLPTSGRAAEITVTGSLPSVGRFEPDPRSSYEWWLLESDPERRVMVQGDARQHDSAESPLARTQPTSRLYMVRRGQHIVASVQTLASVEVLAAVVRSHQRTVVLTRRGDLVADDAIHYENNGIDYLPYDPAGRAIYLATDGASERIMHRDGDAREVMIPLRRGGHTARVQALAAAPIGLLGGRLEIPAPAFSLTASTAAVTVGLPHHVHPLVVTGGDRAEWFVDGGDALAVLVALGVALALARTRGRKALLAVALAGTWFVSQPAFVAVVAIALVAGAIWLASRLLRGVQLAVASVVLVGAGALACLIGGAFVGATANRAASDVAAPQPSYGPSGSGEWSRNTVRTEPAAAEDVDRAAAGEGRMGGRGPGGAASGRDARLGNFAAQGALEGGIIQGVTPVALTLPGYARAVRVTRELVTRQRPFRPQVYYVTSWALAPLALAWLVCLALLARAYRPELAWVRARLRERLAAREPHDAIGRSEPAPVAAERATAAEEPPTSGGA